MRKIPARPVIFLPSNVPSKYKTIYGKNVSRLDFDSPWDLKEWLENNEGVDNFTYYGNTSYNYCYIADQFPGVVQYDLKKLIIAYLDIEVVSDKGFEQPETANQPILAITVKIGERYYTYGCGDYKNTRKDLIYSKARDEYALLSKFLDDWEKFAPDAVTGWNSAFYDIPYLITRITKVLSEKDAQRLSPWKKLGKQRVNIFDAQYEVDDLFGCDNLDYEILYKKFVVPRKGKQERYSLNYISYAELGEKKLDYSEVRGLHRLYKENYQKFIDYNIQDVTLVSRLEEKLKLIEAAITFAYDAKCNYFDVVSQVKGWDCIIFNELKNSHIVVPQKSKGEKTEQYAGAFVKEPIPRLYGYVVSFDLDSLYPTILQNYNISPETLLEKNEKINVENLLDKTADLREYQINNQSIAASGDSYTRNYQGFLPRIIERMYKDRKEYRRILGEKEKELRMVKEEKTRRGL